MLQQVEYLHLLPIHNMSKDLQAMSDKRKEETIEVRKTEFLDRLSNRPEPTTNLKVDSNVTDYEIWETVTWWTSWATGVIKQIWSFSSLITLSGVAWTFVDSEVITWWTSWTTSNSIIN